MSVASQYLALGRRSVMTTLRQPTSIVPSFTFPLLFLAMTSAALARAVDLPGFPEADSYLQFAIATTMVQGGLFGSIAAGAAMATDIESGFFDRLVASPVSRLSILLGRLAGSATIAFVQTWWFFLLTSIFGLRVEGGLIAVLAISIVVTMFASGVASLSVTIALRTGSAETVQGSFPLLFSLLFVSSAFFPRALMDGWFKTVAGINPLSHMIESLRALVIDDFQISEFFTAAALGGGLFLIGITSAALALRHRLALSS